MRVKMPAKTVLLWQLRIIPAVILLFAAAVILRQINVAFFISLALLSLLLAVASVSFLPLYIRSFEIALHENAITVSSGVFIKVKRVIPYPRTAYARSYSTALSRKMGLKGVIIKGARAAAIIPETDTQNADKIISEITEKCDE